MLLLALPIVALGAPAAEEVCVAAERTAPAAIGATRPPAEITAFRAAVAREAPVPPVSVESLLRAIPPPPATDTFALEATAAPHPLDPDRVLLAVRGAAPRGGVTPLKLTLLIDTSDSMDSVPMRELPLLQDQPPAELYPRVTRLELARAALHELVDRLPERASVAVVAFELHRATLLLPPTAVSRADVVHAAIDRAGTTEGGRSILDVTTSAAVQHADLCADNRILLVTDDNARISLDPERIDDALAEWREQGIELWTLSVGTLGRPAPAVARLTERGGGVHLQADTVTEAAEQLAASLRAAGAVVRDARVEVAPDPRRVAAWRRLDGPATLSGPHAWDLPATLDAGWRDAAVYELELVEGAEPGPVATVSWAVSSPVPGEWTKRDERVVLPTPATEAPAWLRDRVVAVLVDEALAGELAPDAVTRLGDALASERGPAREYVAWAHLLAR